jgi:hypothetical protein
MGVSSFDVCKANSFIGPPPGLTTGQVYYVSNTVVAPGGIGGSDGNDGKSPLTPFSTLDYAVSQCVANRGDIIYVMPGHAETVTASDIGIDVAGVSVIGLGNGATRPTFNLNATGSTIAMSAADCRLDNVLLTGGVDAIVAVITVSAADCKIVNVEYRDVTGQCTDGILTTAAANRLEISGLRWDGATAAGTNAAIALVGGDRIHIHDCRFDGNFAVGVIDVRTTATTDLEVHDCAARTQNAADIFLIDTITASTGMIGPRIQIRVNDNAANITEAITGATFVLFGGGASGLTSGSAILVVNLAGEIAMPINTTQSTDA